MSINPTYVSAAVESSSSFLACGPVILDVPPRFGFITDTTCEIRLPEVPR
jgi:hypothetical protein